MFQDRNDVRDEAESPPVTFSSPRLVRDQFVAWLPDEVVAWKLETFLAKYQARIVKVRHNFIQLRVGRGRFSPWSGAHTLEPFRVTIRFNRRDFANSSLAQVNVQLRVLSLFRNQTKTKSDASELLRGLRSCLIAQNAAKTTYANAS